MDSSLNPALGCTPTYDLGPYTGAIFLGTFFSMALWGVATMQLILFFASKYPGDSWRLKTLVLWVWAMDTVHKGLIIAGNYKDLVSGRVINPTGPNKEMILTHIATSWVAVPVQLFFMYRIWRFQSRIRWFFVIPLAPCIAFHFAMGFVLTTVNWIRHNNPEAIPRSVMLNLVIANMVVVAAADVLLAIGLCILLWSTYREVVSGTAGAKSGASMVQRLLLLTINTGIWTALFGLITMATSIRYPQNLIHIAFCFIISPVYLNMLLANLNARSFIRSETDKVIEFNKSRGSSKYTSFKNISIRPPSTGTVDSKSSRTLAGSRNSAEIGQLKIKIQSESFEKYDDVLIDSAVLPSSPRAV
ncbi:hypothetical protein MD484_g5346, partial [Candolleomyces efflorescens]